MLFTFLLSDIALAPDPVNVALVLETAAEEEEVLVVVLVVVDVTEIDEGPETGKGRGVSEPLFLFHVVGVSSDWSWRHGAALIGWGMGVLGFISLYFIFFSKSRASE